MGKRGPAIDANELEYMLELIGEILPIGGMEWDLVGSRHKAAFPDKLRNKETIKKKFNQLKDTKPGTGTAFIPHEVALAKEVWQKILAKMGGEDGEDDEANDELDEMEKDSDSETQDVEIVGESAYSSDTSDDRVRTKLKTPPPTSKTSSSSNKKKRKAISSTDEIVKKPPVFQIPVSKPGTKRSAGNDDNMDKYFSYMMAQNEIERNQERQRREEKREEERVRREFESDRQFRMDMQMQQQQQQQQQFSQMMSVMMMSMMGQHGSSASAFASIPANFATIPPSYTPMPAEELYNSTTTATANENDDNEEEK
jgi:hypothetical protein